MPCTNTAPEMLFKDAFGESHPSDVFLLKKSGESSEFESSF